jgi:hypothetical protein
MLQIVNYDYLNQREINDVFSVHNCFKAKRKATNQYIIKQCTNPTMLGHKNRFEFHVILVTVTSMAIATINNNIIKIIYLPLKLEAAMVLLLILLAMLMLRQKK